MTNYQVFWQAKIWGLLHDPPLKGLYRNKSDEGPWKQLKCMENWFSPKEKGQLKYNQIFSRKWLEYVGLADLISSASDRAAIGRLPAGLSSISYDQDGIEIKHLLSGAKQDFKLGQWHQQIMSAKGDDFLQFVETSMIPDFIKQETDARKVYWWLWRCYPVALSQALDREANQINEPSLALLPAESRLPDGSVWSHTTMTSALAGSLAGYFKNQEDYPQKNARLKDENLSRPHVAVFSFSPVQELIKASRKMRDFWSGSWLLHYLSAKVSWDIAWKYGPDSLLYPCLYEQPLIDLWLLEKYGDFKQWIKDPEPNKLLTAGFPNVLVMILPNNGISPNTAGKNPAKNVLQQAKQTLLTEWDDLGDRILKDLQEINPTWENNLNLNTWQGWLKFQWQFYGVALPIGDLNTQLHQSPRQEKRYEDWTKQQNYFAQPEADLFVEAESNFLKAVYNANLPETWQNHHKKNAINRQPNLNVGSWWPSIFDQTRLALSTVKNARTWEIPTAFGPRSTISGLGPVVHPVYDAEKPDWATEGDTANFWQNTLGLFDGIEELNATEVLKRGLRNILPKLLLGESAKKQDFDLYYPDLTGGAIGWLKQMEKENNQSAINYFQNACQEVIDEFPWTRKVNKTTCGIPWVNTNQKDWLKNPRFLNAGWLIDEYSPNTNNEVLTVKEQRKKIKEELGELRKSIAKKFEPGNNPTDWYVLAAGDGDGMSDWLKGKHLKSYNHYIPEKLQPMIDQLPDDTEHEKSLRQTAKAFLELPKRMGPSTHSALSRALLDFSNQLVPYLTEQRYAGRLIYGGGDDVLAYTNLWEWDNWLWDIRQCFRGQADPKEEFTHKGDYWQKNSNNSSSKLPERPLFTMGSQATISFGIVIAHHSVPLAISLENLWEAEAGAKDHDSQTGKKDAVQVRVLYGNGNILKATTKFKVFSSWQQLIQVMQGIEPAIFEQAATIWEQHPTPVKGAITPWVNAFCERREKLINDQELLNAFCERREKLIDKFKGALRTFLEDLWDSTKAGPQWQQLIQKMSDIGPAIFEQAATTWKQHPAPVKEAIAPWVNAFCEQQEKLIDDQIKFKDALRTFLENWWDSPEAGPQLDQEVKNWLKLAAFVLRQRNIKIPDQSISQ